MYLYKYIIKEDIMLEALLAVSRYALPIMALLIFLLCFVALLKRRPPSLGSAKLINISDKDVYPLIRRETSIGRNKNCDILLKNATVSRLHAVVVCAKDGWYVTDIRSQAGVLINGKKIDKKAYIKTGDKITLGTVTLVFENLKD